MKRILSAALACAMMLLGAAFAECPQFSEEDYPRVDGSTATLPLSYALMSASTGVDESAARQAIRHGKTTQSFYNLIYDSADLLLVYEPSDEVYEAAESAGV